MKLLDFTDRRNKFIPLKDISPEYIECLKQYVAKSPYYPRFHIAPPHGLMNDPNGLCQINGWYHIFYQWFPLGPVHGLKYWYHLKTCDFIHYVDFGPALFPDSELDRDGCFTGMANKEDGTWYIYYTGVNSGIQQVCRAIFDGEKQFTNKELCIPYNPALTTQEFRDPVVYRDQFILVGAQNPQKRGIITVFERQENAFIARGALKLPEELSGYMLECPNLLPLNREKDLLVFSPMGIESPDRFTYRNVFSVVYGIGSFRPDNLEFVCEEYRELDSGFDFYAPQIFQDEQGRTILLGWLGNSKCVYPSDFEQWAHMMTLPREVRYKGSRICQTPVEELKELRKTAHKLEADQQLDSGCFELELTAETSFSICLYNDKGENLVFSGNAEEYCLDRGRTTHLYNERFGTKRYALRDRCHPQNIRIFVDRSAIEIFAEDGYVVFTARFYLDNLSELHCEGVDGTLYFLDSLKGENNLCELYSKRG